MVQVRVDVGRRGEGEGHPNDGFGGAIEKHAPHETRDLEILRPYLNFVDSNRVRCGREVQGDRVSQEEIIERC